jgi:TolA-binding protein
MANEDMKAANERMSLKIANYARLETSRIEQEEAAAAQLNALAAEAASQLESVHKQLAASEAIAKAEAAQKRALEQQLVAVEDTVRRQQQQLQRQQQHIDRLQQELHRPGEGQASVFSSSRDAGQDSPASSINLISKANQSQLRDMQVNPPLVNCSKHSSNADS